MKIILKLILKLLGDVDFDAINSGGLDLPTWSEYAKLSGKVPRISIISRVYIIIN